MRSTCLTLHPDARSSGSPASLLAALEDSIAGDLPKLVVALPVVNLIQIATTGTSMVGVPNCNLFWLPLPLAVVASGIASSLAIGIDMVMPVISRSASSIVQFRAPRRMTGCKTCAILAMAVAGGLPAEVAAIVGVVRLACAVLRNAKLQDHAAYNVSAVFFCVMVAFVPLNAGAALVWTRHVVFQLQNAPAGFQARFASEDLATRLLQVTRLITTLPFFIAAQGDLRVSAEQSGRSTALAVADKSLVALAAWGFWGQGGRVGLLAQGLWVTWLCVLATAAWSLLRRNTL